MALSDRPPILSLTGRLSEFAVFAMQIRAIATRFLILLVPLIGAVYAIGYLAPRTNWRPLDDLGRAANWLAIFVVAFHLLVPLVRLIVFWRPHRDYTTVRVFLDHVEIVNQDQVEMLIPKSQIRLRRHVFGLTGFYQDRPLFTLPRSVFQKGQLKQLMTLYAPASASTVVTRTVR